MKRGGPLARKTPLVNKTPLRSHSTLRNTKPINPQSRTRIKEAPVRAAAERELGRVGVMGTCALCGLYGVVHGHERLGRAQGGDPTRPDCLLCDLCNGYVLEGSPIWAAWHGWKISRKHPRDPILGPDQARRFDDAIITFPVTDVAA